MQCFQLGHANGHSLYDFVGSCCIIQRQERKPAERTCPADKCIERAEARLVYVFPKERNTGMHYRTS